MFYEESPEDTKQYQVSPETIAILSWIATNIALPTILAVLVAPVSEMFQSLAGCQLQDDSDLQHPGHR